MVGKSADIVMALNKRGVAYAGFNAVGINRTLNEVINLSDFLSLRLENPDKLSA